jgi:PAS domain S-box-containing protein
MTLKGGLHRPSSPLESVSSRTLPLWFQRLTYAAGAPVLFSLLLVGVLLVLPTTWRFHPPAIRRVLSFLFDVLAPLLATAFLAVRYMAGGETHWLFVGMGVLAWGAAGFVNTTPLPGDPIDIGMTMLGLSTTLFAVLTLTAVPFAHKPPKEHRSRRSLVALAIGYGGVLVLVTLLAWATLEGRIPHFYDEGMGSTLLRRVVLSFAVVALATAAAMLFFISLRRHPLSLRWIALALALIAIGSWGHANVVDFWGLLALSSRGVLALGSVYLLIGSVLATREPHAEPRVPLAALLRSEAEFRAFFESAGIGAAQIGPDLRFLRVNDRYCEITGYSREELLGASPLDLTHPQDREADRARVRRLFADPSYAYDVEKRYVHKDGHPVWVHVTIRMVRDATGEPMHTVGIVEDITERVLEEHRASRYTRVVAGINRVLSEVVRAETQEEVGNTCLAVALEVTKSPVGFVGEVGNDGMVRELATSAAATAACEGERSPGHQTWSGRDAINGLYGKVIEGAASFFTNDLSSHPASRGTPEGHPPLTSFLGVPLMQRDEVVGVLVVANREGGYTVEQQADLEELAPAMVQALWKKRAEEELRQHLLNLEALDRTNRMLLSEINHRVKNNLSAILGLLHTEHRRLRMAAAPSCESILHDLAERIHNLAAAHTLLSAGGWRPLQLSELVEEVILAGAPLSNDARSLTLEIDPTPVPVTPGQAHHLALVVGELVMNTVKYACSGEGLEIKVRISLQDGLVRMVYCDNGPGYPEAVLAGEGRSVGLELLGKIVTTSLRGTWSVRNHHGAVTEIVFPVAAETNGDFIDDPKA